MARSDLLIELVRSGTVGDTARFRKVVQSVIADERDKRHGNLARELEQLLDANETVPSGQAVLGPGINRSTLPEGIRESWPTRTLESLVLGDRVRSQLDDFVEQQLRAEELRSHGLEPVSSLLLVGPPGCGKTSIAEALANQLAIPLYTVRYETLMSSLLGDSLKRLAAVFDLARRDRCVLFFDEFDAISKERSDTNELGEIKRLVSALLLFLEDAPTYSPVIAATNHPQLIDEAAWRRFPLQLELPLPSRALLIQFFEQWQQDRQMPLGLAPSTLAKAMNGSSFADAEELTTAIARRSVLDGESADVRRIAQQQLSIRRQK